MFGVEYELDLAPFWIKQWMDKRLDSYRIFLHKETGDIAREVVDIFTGSGFSVERIDGPHSDGKLRGLALSYHAGTLPPEDFLVTADADEFHFVDHRRLAEKCDIASGFLADRYADATDVETALQACRYDPMKQYPCEEDFTRDLMKGFAPPFIKTEWPVVKRTKILMARAGHKVSYTGSHCMLETPSSAVISGDHKVTHFAWRESAKRKIACKSYFKKENLDEAFGHETPDDCRNKLSKLQEICL